MTQPRRARRAARAAARAPEGCGRPPAEIARELGRVLAARQELALRLESLAGERGAAADRERAALRHRLACHAGATDRLLAELGAAEAPDGPPRG